MPRLPRIVQPDGYYHIISRSVNELWIFRDAADFQCFYALALEAKKKHPLKLFHYVLMHTHFHFVIQVVEENRLAKYMAFLKQSYSIAFQKKYDWKGPLWRERYRSLAIQNEAYLRACGEYVENNPVRAGICQNPEDYPFGSAKKYHLGAKDRLIDRQYQESGETVLGLAEIATDLRAQKALFSRGAGVGTPLFISSCKRGLSPGQALNEKKSNKI